MTISSDPQYQALARRAASRLGTSSPEIVRAILAQWQCELGNGDAYPPSRNNPGNVAQGFAASTGIPFTAQSPNPQPGNPIVTFASPEAGADAYAIGLSRFTRYAAVRAAVAISSGAGFLAAVTAAGYGTGLGCAMSVYGGNGGAGDTVSGSTPATYASVPPGDIETTLAALLGLDPDTLLTAANYNDIHARVVALVASRRQTPTQNQATLNYLGSVAVGLSHSGESVRLGDIRVNASTGGSTGTGLDPGGFVAGLFGDFAWVPTAMVNAGLLVLILVLGYEGLTRLLDE